MAKTAGRKPKSVNILGAISPNAINLQSTNKQPHELHSNQPVVDKPLPADRALLVAHNVALLPLSQAGLHIHHQ